MPLLDPALLASGADQGSMPLLTNESSQPGLFKATLTAKAVRVPLLKDGPTEFWTYNGSLPGPLIDVMEGDTVEITLHNQLSQPTSIHWHGLPVPPSQDGNPQQAIAPGQRITYRFTLPEGSAGLTGITLIRMNSLQNRPLVVLLVVLSSGQSRIRLPGA
jgi:bilirubin oxidase